MEVQSCFICNNLHISTISLDTNCIPWSVSRSFRRLTLEKSRTSSLAMFLEMAFRRGIVSG